MSKPCSSFNDRGFGLLGVIILIGVMVVASIFTYQRLTNQVRFSKKIRELGEREDLRQFVTLSVDCEETFRGSPNCSSFINLFGSEGNLLVSSNQLTKIGEYSIRAQCSGGASRILNVQVKKNNNRDWIQLFHGESIIKCKI